MLLVDKSCRGHESCAYPALISLSSTIKTSDHVGCNDGHFALWSFIILVNIIVDNILVAEVWRLTLWHVSSVEGEAV